MEILPAAKEIKKELRVIKANEITTMWSWLLTLRQICLMHQYIK